MQISGKHEVYCCGARVRISEKGVNVLGEPLIDYCPLHEAMYGTGKVTRESAKKDIEAKIARFGFCCHKREFKDGSVVAYGASEMMSVWLNRKLIDCAVVVCEGAGTTITNNGKLVQGIGARLTGVIRTSPIPEVVEHIEESNGVVLDKTAAKIDQLEGVKHAFELGFKRVAVSVAGFQSRTIDRIRKFEISERVNVLVFSVCNTCVSHQDVKYLEKADIVCASASTVLRREIGNKAIMQLGVTIPVYVLTEKGKRLVLAYLSEFKDKLVVFRTTKLPYQVESKGPKLKCSKQ